MAAWSSPIEPLEPEDELRRDPFLEQDLTPVEREWYERYKHDPERME